MTEYKLPIIVGIALGIIHGVILWAALDASFLLVSSILYKNKYHLPLLIVGVVDVTIILTVLSSVFWLPRFVAFRNRVMGDVGDDE